MNIYAITSLIGSTSALALGLFVYLKDKKSRINKAFALLSLSIFIWVFSCFKESSLSPSAKEAALFWDIILYTGAAIAPVLFLRFNLIVVGRKAKFAVIVAYIFAIIFAALNFIPYFRQFFIKDVLRRYPFRFIAVPGPLWYLYIIYYAWCTSQAFYHLIEGLKSTYGAKRNQIKYLIISCLIIFIAASMYLFLVFNVKTPPLDNLLVACYSFITAYSIVRYRLMDITVVITKGLAYGALTGVIAGTYIGLMAGVDKLFRDMPGYNPIFAFSLLFIAVLFALIYVLPQMKIRAIEITRRAIFRGKYDYQQELSEATRIIPTMLNLEQLGSYILTKIRDTMAVDKIALLTYTESEHAYSVLTSLGLDQDTTFKVKIGENSALAGLLRNATTPLVKEEMEKLGTIPEQAMELALKHLDSLGAELCVPLMVKEDLTGILTLSNKRTGEMFSEEDLSLLSTIANQVALTIEYIKAVDRIVSEQRYVGLGKAAMRMAHDIKNPLVPLKTFLQILPDKYPKEFSKMSKIDAEFTGRFYESALEGVDRINLLIERALHYARHPQPAFSPVELASLLDDVLIQEEVSIKKAKIELQKQYDSADNNIKADGDQLIELFSNLIGNSIDAMEDSPVKKLTVKTQGLTERVAVEITDTGCGIPKQRIGTIFDPFITYKHKGSGLGLAIAKKIVDDHKGIIELKSEPGKGTTFRIILPRKH